MEIGTDADIDQFLLACLSILAVAHGLDAPFLGSDNLHVLLVEAMLHGICQVYGNLEDCDLSGRFDEALCRSVKSLQKICGMPQTGLVDKALWQMLCGLYEQCTGDGERQRVCGK